MNLRYRVILISILLGCSSDPTGIPAVLPEVTTDEITEITNTTALGKATVTNYGHNKFMSRGLCWSTSAIPTINDYQLIDSSIGLGTFTGLITGLNSNTDYYFRGWADNSKGTAYGKAIKFRTQAIVDADGNSYATTAIGTQVWLKQNLRTSKYSNEDLIPTGVDWGNLTSGAWSYPNGTSANNDPYGKLYNWYAATDPRKLCPTGYHVPSDSEWTILENFLGGSSIAGGKLKEAGISHWSPPNTGADNSSGFTGLPGGNRRGAVNSVYDVFGTMARHWTSTEVDVDAALGRDLVHNGTQVVNGLTNQFNKKYGFSVRCIKD